MGHLHLLKRVVTLAEVALVAAVQEAAVVVRPAVGAELEAVLELAREDSLAHREVILAMEFLSIVHVAPPKILNLKQWVPDQAMELGRGLEALTRSDTALGSVTVVATQLLSRPSTQANQAPPIRQQAPPFRVAWQRGSARVLIGENLTRCD